MTSPAATDPVLFAGGLLFDGQTAPAPGLGLLARQGRIVEVGPLSRFDGFTGPRVDTAGGTLMPGLIDAHVHLSLEATWDPLGTLRARPPGDLTLRILENAQATLAAGFTTVRDLGGADWFEMSVRDAIRAGRHPGPTIRCAGKVITITGGHGAWIGIESDGPEAFRAAVRKNVKHGADVIKVMATGGVLTPGVDPLAAHPTLAELSAAVETAKDLGLRVAAHAQGAEGIRRAVLAGVTSVEHGFELTDELIALMAEKGAWLCGTLASMDRLVAAIDRVPPYVRAKVERFSAMHFDSFRRYVRAGGKVALATDAGTPGNHHGGNGLELTKMVELGMTPLAALVAGTSSAADLLDLPDAGRLRAGAVADLLLVAGDPSRDIALAANPANHRGIWKGGAPFTAPMPGAPVPAFASAGAAGF